MKITIEKCVYNVHPIYNLYAASEDGYVINIIKKKVPHGGNDNGKGYLKVCVRKYAQSKKLIKSIDLYGTRAFYSWAARST